ncbi:MAG: SUMF1/EgtB/PvdO family nonheme iron enzyme [Candidatus Sumerlaeota bacterium]|nr:SUMF1/EgtB/PvdO family nonheme iron enzyme [Candidatus Sumerlaeota bacterium]
MASSLMAVMSWLAPFSQWLPILLDAALKGMALVAAAFIAARAMRRASAAARQMIWFLALASLLALPVWTETINNQNKAGMRDISMPISEKVLDPLCALIPAEAYQAAAKLQPGRAGPTTNASSTTATPAPVLEQKPPSRLDTINAVIRAKLQAGDLRERIQQQSDKTKRAQALAELLAMMDGASDARLKALGALSELRDVPFERGPYAERARKALKDEAPAMRAAAVTALGAIGEAPGDLEAMASLADDPSEAVREFLPQSLCALGGRPAPPVVIATLGKMLNDSSRNVIEAAIGMLIGCPFTPAMEKRVIELSRDEEHGHSAIYFALSPQLDKNETICRRLIEVMETPGDRENQERAAWGLAHYSVVPEARDKVVAAFIRAYDESTNAYVRSECIFGLGTHATQAAAAKLRDIAANDENKEMRKLAGGAMARAKIAAPGPSTPSTLSTPSTQSTPTIARRPPNELSGRELTQDLLARIQQQKDKEKRQSALDELLARLDGMLPGKLEAMEALAKLKEVPFDRRLYLVRIRVALKDSAPAMRQAALKALGGIGEKDADLPSLAALVDDPDPIVRALLAPSLYQLAGANPPEIALNAVAKLLSDNAEVTVRTTVKSLWGNPLNAAGEKRLIELSRIASTRDDVIYYALSTLPKKSELVSRRLIEELETLSSLHQDRAAWGLSHFDAAPDARDLVVAALIHAFDHFSNPYVRENCVYGLGQHATEAAIAKLRVIAEKDEVSKIRKAAQEALKRALSRPSASDSTWNSDSSSAPRSAAKTTEEKLSVDLGSSVTMNLIPIKPGSFLMGSNYNDSEGPVHTVTLDFFWLGETEVTQAQYEVIMGKNPSHFKGADKPVENVPWDDAMDFCKKLSAKTGRTYALPTEAQWEYACRAGSSSKYCFGDSESQLGDYAWYSDQQTHPVKQKKPNAWGLYDMHGNVSEWCSDWFGVYSADKQANPVGANYGPFHVNRGGSCSTGKTGCRATERNRVYPLQRGDFLGFRVACVPSK